MGLIKIERLMLLVFCVCNVPLDFIYLFFYILYPQPQSYYILRSQNLLCVYCIILVDKNL